MIILWQIALLGEANVIAFRNLNHLNASFTTTATFSTFNLLKPWKRLKSKCNNRPIYFSGAITNAWN